MIKCYKLTLSMIRPFSTSIFKIVDCTPATIIWCWSLPIKLIHRRFCIAVSLKLQSILLLYCRAYSYSRCHIVNPRLELKWTLVGATDKTPRSWKRNCLTGPSPALCPLYEVYLLSSGLLNDVTLPCIKNQKMWPPSHARVTHVLITSPQQLLSCIKC